MSFELAAPGKKCPFTGFEKDCRELVISGACESWLMIDGTNPLTGEKIRKWDCAFKAAWIFAATACQKAEHAAKDVIDLRNMIFDTDYRRRELEKARLINPVAIEAQNAN